MVISAIFKELDSGIRNYLCNKPNFSYISTNIVYKTTGKLLFPPYVIKNIDGISVAFIGAITKNARDVILNKNIEGIEFLDEADSINQYIPEIKAQGVKIIVAIMHEGGTQTPYEGPTRSASTVEGPIVDIVNRLDDNVDVVVARHIHQFINAYMKNKHGKNILVAEGNSYSTSFSEITMQVDPSNDTVIKKSARIITAYADVAPGTTPDRQAASLVKLAEDNVAPIINREINTANHDITKQTNADGETALGNLIADALKSSMQTEFAILNPGSMRADIYAGKVSWGNIYAVYPFGNEIKKVTLSGSDLYDLLEQQWASDRAIFLQIAGFNYVYDATQPKNHRVVTIYQNGLPIDKSRQYTIATNSFLLGGGDGFTIFKKATILETSQKNDFETLLDYISHLQRPFSAKIEGRIQRLSNHHKG